MYIYVYVHSHIHIYIHICMYIAFAGVVAKTAHARKAKVLTWWCVRTKKVRVHLQRINFANLGRMLDVWSQMARVARADKLKLMNPHSEIEGLALPPPDDLLRKHRGDVETASGLQKRLQIQIVQNMLGHCVSEVCICKDRCIYINVYDCINT